MKTELTDEQLDAVRQLLHYFEGGDLHAGWPCVSVFSGGQWRYGAVDSELAELLGDLRAQFHEVRIGIGEAFDRGED